MTLPGPSRIFPHPVGVTEAIGRLAIPDRIGGIIHAMKAEFPDHPHGRFSLAKTERMKGADLIFRIGGVTGFHVLGASVDALKTVGPDRLAGGQSFAWQIIHGFIPVESLIAFFAKQDP